MFHWNSRRVRMIRSESGGQTHPGDCDLSSSHWDLSWVLPRPLIAATRLPPPLWWLPAVFKGNGTSCGEGCWPDGLGQGALALRLENSESTTGRTGTAWKQWLERKFLTLGNKMRVAGGEVGGGRSNWVMGIKKGIWCNEHWVLYATDESLNSTSVTNNTLYVT